MAEETIQTKQVQEELPSLVTLYTDGSVVRYESDDPDSPTFSIVANIPSFPSPTNFSYTDHILNPTTNLWARIFLSSPPSTDNRLPVVVHLHGGGFCVGSPSWRMYHFFLGHLAALTNAIWISVAYRLAPEHRLPTSYYDCLDALGHLPSITQLNEIADLRNIFLVGDSAGANLAFQVALAQDKRSNPSWIKGLIFLNPGFIREERSNPSWNKDYFILNPRVPKAAEVLLPPCLVFISGADIFRDRQREFCWKMREGHQEVEVVEYEDMGHCFFLLDKFRESSEYVDLVKRVVTFMKRAA